ncbi:MAG: Cys-tRNA(Pro) deacylase [Oscillospiraceae bacterium]
MKQSKTIAEKLLDKNKIEYIGYEYGSDKEEFMDGASVADAIGKPYNMVFKTLVCHGPKGNCVFVVPVDKELDLKKAAVASGQKYVEMINVKDILSTTGYIKGGCSPIAMKKLFPTFIDSSAQELEAMVFSAGKLGKQIEMSVQELVKITRATLAQIIKDD